MKDYNEPYKTEPIHVLIISDRLFDRAKSLAEYLRGTGNFKVIGLAENMQQAINLVQDCSFDYLIIAGYLKVERTYEVIAELQKQQKEFLTVQWAMIDSLITGFCQHYKIPLKFERTLPMPEFISFLNTHKNDPRPQCPEETQETKTISNQNISLFSLLKKVFRRISGSPSMLLL